MVKGCGGFRPESRNYVGENPVATAIAAFADEGCELPTDGELRSQLIENLSGRELTDALNSYGRRAKKGVIDSALLVGTGKDLMEAT